MSTISLSDAVTLVRKNLDELDPNGSVLYGEAGDNASLDNVIKRTLPEAINAVQKSAPAYLLEGKSPTIQSPSINTDGVLSFTLANFFRLVKFQANDSPIVVTDPIPEASAEGRKQSNRFVRGRYDRPRLVLLQGSKYDFKYYAFNPDGAGFSGYVDNPSSSFTLLVTEEQIYNSEATQYELSARLRQNIIDCLTAMVLDIFKETQSAQVYYQKASNYQ